MRNKKLHPNTYRLHYRNGAIAKEQGFSECDCRVCGAKRDAWMDGFKESEYKYKGLDS